MLSLSKKGGALFDKRDFAPTRASVCASAHEHTLARHQPSGLPRPVPLGRGQRKVFFATYAPNGSPLGGRRREKWIKPYSRPAGRELCEAFLTVSLQPVKGYSSCK